MWESVKEIAIAFLRVAPCHFSPPTKGIPWLCLE